MFSPLAKTLVLALALLLTNENWDGGVHGQNSSGENVENEPKSDGNHTKSADGMQQIGKIKTQQKVVLRNC